MLAIIDYGLGNLGSVVNAFRYLDVEVVLTADKEDILAAEGIILPGVGAFGEGMKNLRKRNLDKVVINSVQKGKPLLGICLGLQLLFSSSEEDPDIKGLDLIKGRVKKFDEQNISKIPHIGWNQIELTDNDPLFKGLKKPRNFYFVHSYYVVPQNNQFSLGKTIYSSEKFTSVVRKNNIWGIQCHPEKSSKTGLKFLQNFSEVVK